MKYTLEVPWPPATGNHTTRKGAGGFYTQASIVKWRALVAVAAAQAGLQLELAGPLEMTIWAAPPDRKARDCDNLRKVLADALVKGRVIADDSNQVITREVFEWFAPVKGGALAVQLVVLPAVDASQK